MGLGVAQICVTGPPVTMLAKEKKRHQKGFFCRSLVALLLKNLLALIWTLHTVLISPADFFAGDFLFSENSIILS